MKKILLVILVLLMTSTLTFAGGGKEKAPRAPRVVPFNELPPPPPGTERLFLSNAAMAIYKFELPAGQTWGNYDKLTAEYLVDEENIGKNLRSGAVRLYGNYKAEHFKPDSGNSVISLSTDSMFANMIIDNNATNWGNLGAVPNEWFTYEYNITGSRAHGQYNKGNLPAANATGPFYFALGLTSQDEGRRNGIVQLVRNITLHHRTNPALNVVSTGSGFEGKSSAGYYLNNADRVSGE